MLGLRIRLQQLPVQTQKRSPPLENRQQPLRLLLKTYNKESRSQRLNRAKLRRLAVINRVRRNQIRQTPRNPAHSKQSGHCISMLPTQVQSHQTSTHNPRTVSRRESPPRKRVQNDSPSRQPPRLKDDPDQTVTPQLKPRTLPRITLPRMVNNNPQILRGHFPAPSNATSDHPQLWESTRSNQKPPYDNPSPS